jgi:alpha-L-fucosidase
MQKIFLFTILISLFACSEKQAPESIDPVPTPQQLEWNKMEFYGFVHFNMNTFTNMEWGYGDEAPSTFNPTDLDCRQWVKTMKDAGMKGVILTAKHHDGFCLWPSKYTEHSVKNSPWKDGKGDVLRELSDACKEFDMKLGLYYSPWDRNHADYGTPEYITYMRNQLEEILTNYGDLFEVWFDGANGGTGYYGGAREERRVDKLTYYDWPKTYELVYKHQPHTVIFSDAGPGCRWIGNENGFAYPTTWSMLMRDSVYGGMPEYAGEWSMGQEDGTHWVPGEADVSIRPGWYYHPEQDDKVKSVDQLMDIYYKSVGRNANLLLNFPVDTTGQIHENDVANVLEMGKEIRMAFDDNFALEGKFEASSKRGKSYDVDGLTSGTLEDYWVPAENDTTPQITLTFDQSMVFNRIVLQENIALGQRIKKFKVELRSEGNWKEIANETTIGYKRILLFDDVEGSALRITFEDYRAIPVISEIGVYKA